ncbi:MAG: class I SAM-dependent methyltransferase [Pseudomonadota bacterium]
MQIDRPDAYETTTELELMESLLPLAGARVLELGCGAAWTTRQLAERYPAAQFIATEVDKLQHAKNLRIELPNVEFRLEGAQAISEPDDSVDIVWMLKSLHHVPAELMRNAMQEISRVLRPGGLAWFSEPVYAGAFNDLMRLIHDEKEVRELAFKTIGSLVESGAMQLKAEKFINVPGSYASWELFESRFLNVTHTKLAIEAERYAGIRSAFLAHMTEGGAYFMKPHRIDLLQKLPKD